MNSIEYSKGLKYLFLILMLSCLPACGFKIYNKSSFPLQLQTIYLQSSNPYDSFNVKLKQALKFAGIKLVPNVAKAPVTLNIVGITISHDDPNITSSSQATIYNFIYTVMFELKNKNGKSLLDLQTITVTRALTLNPNDVLEISSEVQIMKGEMERELIMQLFNRLDSNNIKGALNAGIR